MRALGTVSRKEVYGRPCSFRGGPVRLTVRIVLLAALLATAEPLAAQGGFHSISITPDPPTAGEDFTVTILLPGASARELGALEPSVFGDLSFVSLTVSPAVTDLPDGSPPGARVAYTFRAKSPGDLRLPRLELAVAGVPLPIGPLVLQVRPSDSSTAPALYSWRAPGTVFRWQCFPAYLMPRNPSASAVREYGVAASEGLSLEPFGEAAFVGIALAEGDLFLPPATSREGVRVSEGAVIRSLPAPRGIADSRAVGDFTLRLLRLGHGPIRAGETLIVRVEVRGRGNLPILKPPGIRIRGAGSPVSAPLTVPIADLRVAAGTYEGMTGSDVRFVLESPGDYVVESEPFTFLNPDTGELRTLRALPLRLSVEPVPRELRPFQELRFLLESRVSAYSDSTDLLSKAASLARDGEIEAALELLSGQSSPEALHLKGILLMSNGDGAGALAALGAAERQNRSLPGLAETLRLCETSFQVGPRIRDRLPRPRIFVVLSIVLGTAGLVALVIRPARSNFAGGPLSSLGRVLLSVAVLALLGFMASSLERRFEYAVVAAPDSFTLPSDSGSSAGSFQGRGAIVAAGSSEWFLLRFPDGRSAWFRAGDILRY